MNNKWGVENIETPLIDPEECPELQVGQEFSISVTFLQLLSGDPQSLYACWEMKSLKHTESSQVLNHLYMNKVY